MICPRCGAYVTSNEIVCPVCGTTIDPAQGKESGVQAIRQGLHARDSVPEAAAAPRRHRRGASRDDGFRETALEDELPVYGDGAEETEGFDRFRSRPEEKQQPGTTALPKRKIRTHEVKQRMINWSHVIIAAAALFVLMIVGVYFYLTRTMNGQMILARLGRDTTSQALWRVGEEELDTGMIEKSIELMERARKQDGDEVNVDGMLTLGSAYEAAGDTESAKAIYKQLYEEVVPTRAEPYRSMIRILLADGDSAEAAVLMQTAYEKTGLTSFREQRSETLPSPPGTSLPAGSYSTERSFELSGGPDDVIYYTFDEEAELPAGGIVYESPVHLGEGIYTLRAVAVNGELISDQLKCTYKIIMPSPQKPQTSLAPATYKQRQRVRLRPGDDNKEDKDITIYYTIDGSNPDADSPVWVGEPIILPGGRVTLKAIAVNGYGKMSNQLSVLYKIEAKPYPETAYGPEEIIGDIKLNGTKREAFEAEYGTGLSVEPVTVDKIDNPCEKVTYSWGWAIFQELKSGWMIIELDFHDATFTAPRGTHIGASEDEIVSKFRDMGQLASPSGNRGLYYNKNSDYGRILKTDDGKIIRYLTATLDGHIWKLDYRLDRYGTCEEITWTYLPNL